jgi:haloalkane dehalogenase
VIVEILRTPDQRFENLFEYKFEPHYTEVPSGEGSTLRIHHIDEGPENGEVIVCTHGQPSWSYLYRQMIPYLTSAGYRIIAPDLVGFGRSDKPARVEDYSYARHVQWMTSWFQEMGLEKVNLFCQDWGGLIGLRIVADHPEYFARVIASNTALPDGSELPPEMGAAVQAFYETLPVLSFEDVGKKMAEGGPQGFLYWRKYCAQSPDFNVGDVMEISSRGLMTAAVRAAYEAPFPDSSYLAGARQFPTLVPIFPDDPAIADNRAAWKKLERFDRPFLTAFSDRDPVTRGMEKKMQKRIPGAKDVKHVTIKGAGHFLQQERAEELAMVTLDFIKNNGSQG